MKTVIKCPICSKTDTDMFLTSVKNSVYSCKNCTVKFLFPPPSKYDLKAYYAKGYFEGAKKGVRGYKDYSALEKSLMVESDLKIKLIREKLKTGRILDIGAGTGIFAQQAKKNGFLVSANDISPFAIKALKSKKIICYTGPVSKKIFPEKTFDAVTAWDVVEHVFDIREMLNAVNNTLKNKGLFYLTTPDTGSLDAKLMGKNWYGYKKIPEHILFFNRRSITDILNTCGFDVIQVKRWGFYRDINFVIDKLTEIDGSFAIGRTLIKSLSLGEASMFIPLTDFLIIAQKRD